MTRAAVPATLAAILMAGAPAQAMTPVPAPATFLVSAQPGSLNPFPLAVRDSVSESIDATSQDGDCTVFTSRGDALSSADDDAVRNVYLRRRSTATTTLVSIAADGTPAHGDTNSPSIDDNCTTVAFSSSVKLAPDDTNTTADVYVRRLGPGTTTLVSALPAGGVGNGASEQPHLSGDASAVVFVSAATNFDPVHDLNGQPDVYRRTFTGGSGTLTLISRVSGNNTAAGDAISTAPAVNDDGTVVAFQTQAKNLDPNVTSRSPNTDQVYVRDLNPATATTRLASAVDTVATSEPVKSSLLPAISGNGLTVAFGATSSLDGQDANGTADIYRRTLATHTTVLVSRLDGTGTVAANGGAYIAGLSDDGNEVAFLSYSDNIVGGLPADQAGRIFVRDVTGATTQLVSRADGVGAAIDGSLSAGYPAISGDGAHVAFSGGALPGAPLNTTSVYVRDIPSVHTELLSRPSGSGDFSNPGADGAYAGYRSQGISRDGRYVAYLSSAAALPGGDGITSQLYVRDLLTDADTLVSRADGASGVPADTDTYDFAISANGRRVAFLSESTNLPGSSSGERVWVRDLDAGTTVLASRADGANGALPDDAAGDIAISGDGNRVAFETDATNLGDGDSDNSGDIHVRDLAAGRTLFASSTPVGANSDGHASEPSLDDTGRHVAFTSTATNIGAGADGHPNVFVRDLGDGSIQLASNRPGQPAADGSEEPSLSADGTRVAFRNVSLAQGVPYQAYVRDLAADTLTLLSADAAGNPGISTADALQISADGQLVAWVTAADNLTGVPSLTAVVRPVSGGPVEVVSRRQDGSAGPASRVWVNGDGGCLAFAAGGGGFTTPATGTDESQMYMRARNGACPRVPSPSGGGGGAGGTPNPPVAGVLAPKLSRVGITNKRFKVGAKKTAVSAAAKKKKKTPTGTTFTFTLDRAATVKISITQTAKGKKKGKACVKPTAKLRKAKACTRIVLLGALTRKSLKAGKQRVAFSGRIGAKKLKPGRYTATITPSVTGATGLPRTVTFTVVSR